MSWLNGRKVNYNTVLIRNQINKYEIIVNFNSWNYKHKAQ